METDAAPIVTVELNLGSEIDMRDLTADGLAADIDVGVGSGLNADRVIKLITDLKAETIASLRSLVLRVVGVGEVKGVKISLDAVEIGSVQTADLDRLRTTINETLDELARHKKAQGE